MKAIIGRWYKKYMEKEQTKQRCQYSKEGLKTFGKQRRGYVIGETRDGRGWRVAWDGLKSPQTYAKSFIEVNPLIDLFVDDDGVEKEKPIEISEERDFAITPEIIVNIETALNKIKQTGISQRGLEVLIKDYCGVKVGMTEIREVLKAIGKLKSYYF